MYQSSDAAAVLAKQCWQQRWQKPRNSLDSLEVEFEPKTGTRFLSPVVYFHVYILRTEESLWTSLCTLPRLRFPYMQARRELCASFVVAPAAALVCAVIFQQWQIQSNFSSYVTLFLPANYSTYVKETSE